MSGIEMRALRRVRAVAKKYGLAELAGSHADFFGSSADDVFRLAPYVCAAAQDKYRHSNAGLADKICEEVWADSWLFDEAARRDRRDLSIASLRDSGFGPHFFYGTKNTYTENIDEVLILLRCPNCGATFSRNYESALKNFRQRCPNCGAH